MVQLTPDSDRTPRLTVEPLQLVQRGHLGRNLGGKDQCELRGGVARFFIFPAMVWKFPGTGPNAE